MVKDTDSAASMRTVSIRLIELHDYLEATSEAARRTRFVVITMVVACALIVGALINSLQHQWMFERIHTFYGPQVEPHKGYVKGKILPPELAEKSSFSLDLSGCQGCDNEKYKAFYDAMVKSYVENTLAFKVPLFGFNVDVNDIGMIGGLAFIVILVMYRFCLIREVDNLRIAKQAAEHENQLREFYNVLAMRQVFTIPPSDTKTTYSKTLDRLPKLICALPVLVQLTVTSHDIWTFRLGNSISPAHNSVLIGLEVIFVLYILLLTKNVTGRIIEIDGIWTEWWEQILAQKAKQLRHMAATAGHVPESVES
jgi:hypothetical protein